MSTERIRRWDDYRKARQQLNEAAFDYTLHDTDEDNAKTQSVREAEDTLAQFRGDERSLYEEFNSASERRGDIISRLQQQIQNMSDEMPKAKELLPLVEELRALKLPPEHPEEIASAQNRLERLKAQACELHQEGNAKRMCGSLPPDTKLCRQLKAAVDAVGELADIEPRWRALWERVKAGADGGSGGGESELPNLGSDVPWRVLGFLLDACATSQPDRATQGEAEKHIKKDVAHAVVVLKDHGLVKTSRGRGGGIWLTDEGEKVARAYWGK